MDAGSLRVLEVVGYYAAAYLVTGVMSHYMMRVLFGIVTTLYLRDPSKKGAEDKPDPTQLKLEHLHRSVARLIGDIERVMYTTAILMGLPEFIGVWLILKAAGEWRSREKESSEASGWVGVSRQYNIFLIGNALSLIAGVASGLLMRALLPPFPSLKPWQLPLFTHIAAPVA